MVEDKVNEVFAKMQDSLGIINGDIEPMMYARLTSAEDKLSEIIKEALIFQCETNSKKCNIRALLSEHEKDCIFREVWAQRVSKDALERAKETEKNISEKDAEVIADRFVNDGDYESGLSYWTNLDKLTDKYIMEKGAFN